MKRDTNDPAYQLQSSVLSLLNGCSIEREKDSKTFNRTEVSYIACPHPETITKFAKVQNITQDDIKPSLWLETARHILNAYNYTFAQSDANGNSTVPLHYDTIKDAQGKDVGIIFIGDATRQKLRTIGVRLPRAESYRHRGDNSPNGISGR